MNELRFESRAALERLQAPIEDPRMSYSEHGALYLARLPLTDSCFKAAGGGTGKVLSVYIRLRRAVESGLKLPEPSQEQPPR